MTTGWPASRISSTTRTWTTTDGRAAAAASVMERPGTFPALAHPFANAILEIEYPSKASSPSMIKSNAFEEPIPPHFARLPRSHHPSSIMSAPASWTASMTAVRSKSPPGSGGTPMWTRMAETIVFTASLQTVQYRPSMTAAIPGRICAKMTRTLAKPADASPTTALAPCLIPEKKRPVACGSPISSSGIFV